MNTVLADTYYFLALLNPADKGHAKALNFTRTFTGKMVTTGWVLTELADALAATFQGRAELLSTLADLRADPDAEIVPCTHLLISTVTVFPGLIYYPAGAWI